MTTVPALLGGLIIHLKVVRWAEDVISRQTEQDDNDAHVDLELVGLPSPGEGRRIFWTEGILLASECYDDRLPVNLGNSYETSIKDLLETIVSLTGRRG